MDLIVSSWEDYELIDTGRGRKLERFGRYVFSRPCPQALWECQIPEKRWASVHAEYLRSSSGGGTWHYHGSVPESWLIRWNTLTFMLKPTGFGHLGIFPEQVVLWKWMRKLIADYQEGLRILNLFAYTGCGTCAVSSKKSEVCHVDGSKGAVKWARQNASLNGLDTNPIRWIVDDVSKFVQREYRRGKRYNGIMLDPPSFGRGPKGQVWKLEKKLPDLIRDIRELLVPPRFLVITCHSQHVSVPGLENLVRMYFPESWKQLEAGHLLIQSKRKKYPLPSGVYVRFADDCLI